MTLFEHIISTWVWSTITLFVQLQINENLLLLNDLCHIKYLSVYPHGRHVGGIHANKGRCCNSYCSCLRKCSCTVFFIERRSFDRDKAAVAAHRSYSILQSIKRTVLTRQSFVSHLQSPDPSRIYKEVQYSPAPGLVWTSHIYNGQGKFAI